jgi:hypothetical protein
MSYTIQEAISDRQLDIECAIMTENTAELYRLAEIIKGEGDDELAERLLAIKTSIDDKNDWECYYEV